MLALAVTGALAGLGIGAPTAGAQQSTDVGCSYSVAPTVLPVGGGFVTVSGTAPGSSVVRVFVDRVLVATVEAAPITGEFSARVFISTSSEIAVAVDDYPLIPCDGVSGGGTSIIVGGNQVSRLASTGSSDTLPYARAGIAALAVGAVLLAAARRRASVRGRA